MHEAPDASPSYQITTLQPRSYNEARQIGEAFREHIPVIMNLTDMSDDDAKRLVDFAAGLIFGLRGTHREGHEQGLPAVPKYCGGQRGGQAPDRRGRFLQPVLTVSGAGLQEALFTRSGLCSSPCCGSLRPCSSAGSSSAGSWCSRADSARPGPLGRRLRGHLHGDRSAAAAAWAESSRLCESVDLHWTWPLSCCSSSSRSRSSTQPSCSPAFRGRRQGGSSFLNALSCV